MAAVPNISLNNGVEIPQLGFGVFQITPNETAAAVAAALKVGYRHIDTAEMYGNEEGSVRRRAPSELDPCEVFVTSKLNNGYPRVPTRRSRAFDETSTKLRHGLRRPVPDPLAAADTVRPTSSIPGRRSSRCIGGRPGALDRRVELPGAPHPPAARPSPRRPGRQPDRGAPVPHPGTALRAFDAEHGIATEAWSPIAQGKVLDDPAIERSRPRTAVPGAGRAALARAARRHRLPEVGHPGADQGELRVFDFELPDGDMASSRR